GVESRTQRQHTCKWLLPAEVVKEGLWSGQSRRLALHRERRRACQHIGHIRRVSLAIDRHTGIPHTVHGTWPHSAIHFLERTEFVYRFYNKRRALGGIDTIPLDAQCATTVFHTVRVRLIVYTVIHRSRYGIESYHRAVVIWLDSSNRYRS